jgi:hypothetical protein
VRVAKKVVSSKIEMPSFAQSPSFSQLMYVLAWNEFFFLFREERKRKRRKKKQTFHFSLSHTLSLSQKPNDNIFGVFMKADRYLPVCRYDG